MASQDDIPLNGINGVNKNINIRNRKHHKNRAHHDCNPQPLADVPKLFDFPFISTNWVRDADEPRKEKTELTFVDPNDTEHLDQVTTRWIHLHQPSLTFQDFRNVVGDCLTHNAKDLEAAQRCLDDVKRLHEKTFVNGKFIEAIVHEWQDKSTSIVDEAPPNLVRFQCFPLFALHHHQRSKNVDLHPPRAMAQYFYNLENTWDRDNHQTIRKHKGDFDPDSDIIHVFHLWSMTIGNSITITAAPFPPSVLLKDNNDLTLPKYHENFGRSVRYTDSKQNQYFFPLNECKVWNQLIKKIDNLRPAGKDAAIILDPNAELKLVDQHKRIMNQDRWAEIVRDSNNTKLVILQLLPQSQVLIEGSRETEMMSSLSKEEQEKMDDLTQAFWQTKWATLQLTSRLKKLQRQADATKDETERSRLNSEIENQKIKITQEKRYQMGLRLRLAAKSYRPTVFENTAMATDGGFFQDPASVDDPDITQTSMSPEATILLKKMADILDRLGSSTHGTSLHGGYYPRSNIPISRDHQYRQLPASLNSLRVAHNDSSIHNPIPLADPAPPNSSTLRNPLKQYSVGRRLNERHFDKQQLKLSPVQSATASPNASTASGFPVDQKASPVRGHGRSDSRGSGRLGASTTPTTPTKNASGSPRPPQLLTSSPLVRAQYRDQNEKPSNQLNYQMDTGKMAPKPPEVSSGLFSAPKRRSSTMQPSFSNLNDFTPILEWPLHGDNQLVTILETIDRRLEDLTSDGDHRHEVSKAYNNIQESNRDACFELFRGLDNLQGNSANSFKVRRAIYANASNLLDCYVSDHYDHQLVRRYWGIVSSLCQMDASKTLVHTPNSQADSTSVHQITVLEFIRDESWNIYKKANVILKSVQSNSTKGTLPYWLPKPLIDSFQHLIELFIIALEETDQTRLQDAVKRVMKKLMDAERVLPRIAEDAEEDAWKHIGYERVDAHALLGLIMENSMRICSLPGQDPAGMCFNILAIYQLYVSKLHRQARDDASLKVYQHIKLVSEELGIIKRVLDIQWEVAAAHEICTSRSSSKLETRVMSRIFDRICEYMGDFDELIEKVSNARFEATQSIEMQTDLNNKAILIFTTVSTIFLPMTFISGFLSMNTVDINHLQQGQWLFWAIAVPLTVTIMICALCFAYYHSWIPLIRKKWGKYLGIQTDIEG